MLAGGAQASERGVFNRPFVFGAILTLLFFTAFSEWETPAHNTSREVTTAGPKPEHEEPEVQLRDKIVHKLSVTNAQLEKENRILRIHLLELRKIVRGCKGANFTTDLENIYHLGDLHHLRGKHGAHSKDKQQVQGEETRLEQQQPQKQQTGSNTTNL